MMNASLTLTKTNSLNHCFSALISVSKSHLGRESRILTAPSSSSIHTRFHCICLGVIIYTYLTIHRYPAIHSRSVPGEYLYIFLSIYFHAAICLNPDKYYVTRKGSRLTSAQSSVTRLYSVRYSPLYIINSCKHLINISFRGYDNC